MKQVKYFLLARFVRVFLQFGFLSAAIGLLVNLSLCIFSDRNHVEIGGFIFGEYNGGYPIRASLRLNIPDSVKIYENGTHRYYDSRFGDDNELDTAKLLSKTTNVFNTLGTASSISVSNRISIPNDVFVNVKSPNRFDRFLFAIQSNLNLIFYAWICLILVKLTNRYMDGNIFEIRSFRLISSMGVLLICKELLMLIAAIVNMAIISDAHLISTLTKDGRTEQLPDNINISVNFFGSINFTSIGIGIMIVLLSQVIKEAIIAKTENELTI